MTNLQRWLMYFALIAIPYMALVFGPLRDSIMTKWKLEIQLLPIVLVILFGLYAVSTVLYRTLTFNDCPEASKELQLEIQEARKDLISKGFKFSD